MLHLETIEPSTFKLLKSLQNEEYLHAAYLVGGTSLALRKGYRKSVDLDLFLKEEFDAEQLSILLQQKYGFKETYKRGCTLKGDIENVKIDIIRYDYDFIREPENNDGIRMLSIPDIIAMKLSVISDNGTRVKDFVDIAFLSKEYSLEEMIGFYSSKFPNSNAINPMIAITYYEDIDHTDPVNLIGYEYDWKHIETRLMQMTKNFQKRFSEYPCIKIDNTKKILAEHFRIQPEMIELKKEIVDNKKEITGKVYHFKVNGKNKTCVTDTKTKDICICDGLAMPGKFHLFLPWKTLEGKAAVYNQTRVVSITHKQCLGTSR